MSIFSRILGKQTVEIKLEYVSDQEREQQFREKAGRREESRSRNRVLETARKYVPMEYFDALSELPEEYQAHGALLESVRDNTPYGSVDARELQSAIERVMSSSLSIDEKWEALDVLDTRAVNALDYDEKIEIRREVGDAELALLIQDGKINEGILNERESEAVQKYFG